MIDLPVADTTLGKVYMDKYGESVVILLITATLLLTIIYLDKTSGKHPDVKEHVYILHLVCICAVFMSILIKVLFIRTPFV